MNATDPSGTPREKTAPSVGWLRAAAWLPLAVVVVLLSTIQTIVVAPFLNTLLNGNLPWQATHSEDFVTYALQFLLLTGNAVLLAWMTFVRNALRLRHPGDNELGERITTLSVGTMVLLVVWACVLAAAVGEEEEIIWLGAIASAPTLIVSFSFLWFATRTLRSLTVIGAGLAGFVALTAFFQTRYTTYGRGDPSEMILVLNSALIGLAIAVWLVAVSRPNLSETQGHARLL